MLITASEDDLAHIDGEHLDCLTRPPTIKARGTRRYHQTDVDYDPVHKALWTVMNPMGVPCCNQNMVEEFHDCFQQLQQNRGKFLHNGEWHPVQYAVVASRHPTVFNLGGDLALLLTSIQTRDRAAMDHYARLCVDTLYMRMQCFDAPIVTISLVQGNAMGGGLELALSSDVIIAEQGSRMGLPEIMFNLFPAMGAYSLLSRRIGVKLAEEMIFSGNIYPAEELHWMGVVDTIAPRGEGEKAVGDFIRKRGRRLNAIRSIYQCRRYVNPVSYDELMKIANLWVDAIFRLDHSDTNIMSHLLRSQRSEQEKRIKAGKLSRPRFPSVGAPPENAASPD